MDEDYVRPPIVATEPASRRSGTWRFRIVVGALLAALAVVIVLIARSIIDSGEGNAQGAPAPLHDPVVQAGTVTSIAATVPPPGRRSTLS